MKVVDAPRWRATKAELCADETGEQLLTFIEHWCGNAEHILAHRQDYDNAGAIWTPLEALRLAFEITEHELAVYWSAHMVGQALVAVCANWEHGEGLYAGMTPLERRIVQTAAEMILEEQQRGAQALSDQTSV